MSSMQMKKEEATPAPGAAAVALKLEVVVIPVSDVDRAKRFYETLGWRLDADFTNGKGWRGVQLTPPGSPSSIHIGSGITTAAPGSAQGLYLIVEDLEAARADLKARGVDVSDPFHFEAFGEPPVPGLDPQRGSYKSFATFRDPDGNGWLLQEVKTRLPGRGESNLDVPTLTEFLREAETHHGEYEPTARKHHWSDWYAAYVVAREHGQTADDAAKAGARNVERAGR